MNELYRVQQINKASPLSSRLWLEHLCPTSCKCLWKILVKDLSKPKPKGHSDRDTFVFIEDY